MDMAKYNVKKRRIAPIDMPALKQKNVMKLIPKTIPVKADLYLTGSVESSSGERLENMVRITFFR